MGISANLFLGRNINIYPIFALIEAHVKPFQIIVFVKRLSKISVTSKTHKDDVSKSCKRVKLIQKEVAFD